MSHKAIGMDGKPVKNIMRRFRLDEISAVDMPAQAGAVMTIMKRDDSADKGLAALLTSSDEGHQHGVNVEAYDGDPYVHVSYASGPEGDDHNHEVVVQNGEFILSENEGHTHTLDADMVQRMLMAMMIENKRAPVDAGSPAEPIGKTQPQEIGMADKIADNSAEIAKRDDTIKKQSDQIEELTALVNMSAEHRAHYDTLTKSAQNSFLYSKDDVRDASIAKAVESDPVVHTTDDGLEIRKSDGPLVLAMAKKLEAQETELAEKRIEVEQAEFTKRADTELALLPGETIHKVALLRACSKITDEETRKGAEEMLVKAAKVFSLALDTRGVSVGSPTTKGTAEGAFFAKAKEIADDKGVSAVKAQEMLLDTPEGGALYTAYQAERKARNANIPNSN